MKIARKSEKLLTLVGTLLLLAAIPISMLGVNEVNDIRNRASEAVPDLSFSTDFSSETVTNAYLGVPYQQTLELAGDYAPIASIHLGCDPSICGSPCSGIQHTPPEGFELAPDGKTLYWEKPAQVGEVMTWPITVTATAPHRQSESGYLCEVKTFSLSALTHKPEEPPICSLVSDKQLSLVPAGTQQEFYLIGTDYDSGITSASVTVTDTNGAEQKIDWTFDPAEKEVILNKDSSPPLQFTLPAIGPYTVSAQVTDASEQTTECETPTGAAINIVIPGDNGSPEFQTDPYRDSRPATSLTTGQSYTYTVDAEDPNGDDIDYFTINATDWLNFTVNRNEEGEFQGTFAGTPTAPGSYTAAVALNDGFHNHYTTQIWVINVDSPTNDTPSVTVTLPAAGSIITPGSTTRIEWQASDRNLITRFDVYLATDPSRENSWVPLITGLGYDFNAYMWNTASTPTGTYYIVVKATDNQTPPAVGTGISGAIGIGTVPAGQPVEEPDDADTPEIVDAYPTITNLSPKEKSEISDSRPLISASLTASKDQTIETGSVNVKLDDNDLTGIVTVRGEGEADGSILFRPSQPLASGSHKVSVTFKDSSGQTATKTWTFSITGEEEEPPDEADTMTILGFTVPRRIAIIIGVGLVLILLAITIPWLFYASWVRSRDDDDYPEPPHSAPPPPRSGPPATLSGIAVQPKVVTIEKKDPSDSSRKDTTPPREPAPIVPQNPKPQSPPTQHVIQTPKPPTSPQEHMTPYSTKPPETLKDAQVPHTPSSTPSRQDTPVSPKPPISAYPSSASSAVPEKPVPETWVTAVPKTDIPLRKDQTPATSKPSAVPVAEPALAPRADRQTLTETYPSGKPSVQVPEEPERSPAEHSVPSHVEPTQKSVETPEPSDWFPSGTPSNVPPTTPVFQPESGSDFTPESADTPTETPGSAPQTDTSATAEEQDEEDILAALRKIAEEEALDLDRPETPAEPKIKETASPDNQIPASSTDDTAKPPQPAFPGTSPGSSAGKSKLEDRPPQKPQLNPDDIPIPATKPGDEPPDTSGLMPPITR
ncbi:MAG: Ig-like domain-containing protein [Candidatus Dojkabacteria bacterium]|nr:Ig-like domain-containing protein [Candidatus Dojkabacteria bacterium]